MEGASSYENIGIFGLEFHCIDEAKFASTYDKFLMTHVRLQNPLVISNVKIAFYSFVMKKEEEFLKIIKHLFSLLPPSGT